MEEDIKILKNFIQYNKFYKEENGQLTITIDLDVKTELDTAITNLIHDLEYNKVQFATQLREKLDLQANSIPKSKVKEKIEELDNKRRKFTTDNVNNFYLQEFTRKYTQKSDHDYGVFSTPETITYCTNNELLGRIEVLQELLREE